ncbi:mannosyltransferase putative-domain-containing protein [Umbelopsis sp. PMI_123]|nr:mannosyltransferase putative-domain-containing protein [Umbelopsis sp. PMI_123]
MKPHVAGPGRLLTIPRIAVALLLYTTFIYFAIQNLADISHPTITPAHKRALDLLASDQGQFIIENLQKISDKIREVEVKDPSSEPEDSQPTSIFDYDSVARNTDPNHTKAHLQFWQNLSPKAIEMYKHDWKQFVSNLLPYSSFQDKYEGSGIVFTAGNKDTLNRTLTIISILRDYGCNLPVEVWHLADEVPSIGEVKQLQALAAVSKDLSDANLVRPAHKKRDAEKQFQIKAAAIINSGFQKVLYLDSDNIPTRNPEYLFHSKEFEETGALFWPDFWKTHPENRIFDILDIPCSDTWEQESGQIYLDKQKAWVPLQLAWYLQSHHELYFQLLNGDKDTFKYAWEALGAPYHMAETFLGMAGTIVEGRYCGHTMVQYDLYGSGYGEASPLFVHANLLKITDKAHFQQGEKERPWVLLKRYTATRGNTWLHPEFYIAPYGRACMDFTHPSGEPDAITEPFDDILPGFQERYFELGGRGGEQRVSV